MSDLNLSPAAIELSESLIEASVAAHPDYEPGKVGVSLPLGAIMGGLSAEGAAVFVQGLLVDYAGPAAHAFIEAEHATIAAWISPKLADLAASLIGEFGTKIGGDPSVRKF